MKRRYILALELTWMTIQIKKVNETHIIHNKDNYMESHITERDQKKILLAHAKMKHNSTENWPKHPQEVPYYRSTWGSNDLYDKSFD
jgi:hypothetical protein